MLTSRKYAQLLKITTEICRTWNLQFRPANFICSRRVTVSVQLLLDAQQYRDMLQWYKADIQSGAAWFIMPLLSVDEDQEIQYRYVRIQNGELNAQLVSTNATRGSIYRVSFTLDASNTVVDDGSWEDHYLPTADDGSAQGEFVAIPTADIIDDADDLGDSSGTYTIIEE